MPNWRIRIKANLLESSKAMEVIRQAVTELGIERVSPPAEPTLFDMV